MEIKKRIRRRYKSGMKEIGRYLLFATPGFLLVKMITLGLVIESVAIVLMIIGAFIYTNSNN